MTHGERRWYAAGCRCLLCRAANADYSRTHRIAVGLVAAAAARAHLAQLAQLGIGIRQVAKLTGVSASTVANVRSGRIEALRPSTNDRLLAAPATTAHGAFVAATRSWRYLDSLQREGYTRREIAWSLGCHSQQLQLARRHIRQSTAGRIARVYARLAAV